MKKFAYAIGLILLSFASQKGQAQTEKGAMFVQKATMSITPSLGVRAISFQDAVTPQVQFGYFYQRNIAVGANVQIQPPFNALTLLSLRGNIAGFGRYYFDTPIRGLKPYGQGNIGYSQGKNANGLYEARLGASGQIGFSYFTNNIAGIDVNMTGVGLEGVTTTAGTRVQGIYPSWSQLKFNFGIIGYLDSRNPPKPTPNNNNNKKPVVPVPKKPVKKPSGSNTPPKKPVLNPSKGGGSKPSNGGGGFKK
jgi:hypothetical protein